MSSAAPHTTSQHREAVTATATSPQNAGRTGSATHEPEPSLLQPWGNQAIQSLLGRQRIQAKLTVNQPGDRFEQEADRVAEQVMRMPEPQDAAKQLDISGTFSFPSVQRKCAKCEEEERQQGSPPAIQRRCSHCEEELHRQLAPESGRPEVTSALATRIQSLRSGGQALPVSVRHFFEPHFGRDFAQVRVQTDASARDLQARAYTVGRSIVFGEGQYSPETTAGKRLLAHELTHVVQQGGAAPRQNGRSEASATLQRSPVQENEQISGVVQRAGDPAAIPPGFPCPTDLTAGRPTGTDLLFANDRATITPAHTAQLTLLRTTWLTAGGTDDILVHGYASTVGAQDHNWTLSCNRAQSVQAELIRLGIPAVRVQIVAHGESTDFGSGAAANQHAVATLSSPGILSLHLVFGLLTPRDNFAGRSTTRFGVGEIIDLSFSSLPLRPAADFGGLEWRRTTGTGTITSQTQVGTAVYTAPAVASTETLELRVASGATAGRVVSTRTISIVIPSGVRMVAVPGTAPGFMPGGTIPVGTWGAGFLADVFVDPRDISFQGVVFGEGAVAAVVTPAGSFLTPGAGRVHPANTFGPGHGGNATTGTPVSPPRDQISGSGLAPTGTFAGLPTCGSASDFLWAIPWEFSVAGGTRTPFAGGFTANHHMTSTAFCAATIEKGGAGPFCRRINGTTC
jgi:outer membrane protein OmpA-like peptidoglycan-associated protein